MARDLLLWRDMRCSLRIGWVFSGVLLLSGCDADETQNLVCDGAAFSEVFVVNAGLVAPESRLCLPHSVLVDAGDQAGCVVVTASTPSVCSCDAPGLKPVDPEHSGAAAELFAAAEAFQTGWNCFCEVEQLTEDAQIACRVEAGFVPAGPGGSELAGFCYADATRVPPIGNPELSVACLNTEKRVVRLLGAGLITPDGGLLIACEKLHPACE